MITIHKTSLKLSSLYLGIIMAISLFFSATLYQISIQELERGLRRPLPVFTNIAQGNLPGEIREQLLEQRAESFLEAKDKLIANLVLTNIIILLCGGVLSYYLALRTLKPIEDAHEAQSIFAANASHELRTPITAMRSETEVALMDPNLTLDEAKQQLKSNIEELEKLTALSEGLLQLAKAEGAELSKEVVPVQAIIDAAIKRLQTAADTKDITLKVIGSKTAHAIGNQTALTEIMAVLIDNAIKYSPRGTMVTIKTTIKDDVRITVQDQGPGIAEDVQAHIFDRFYRADASRTKQQTDGYGLGLALAKGLADANDAALSVQSKPGQGSIFGLSLPKHIA